MQKNKKAYFNTTFSLRVENPNGGVNGNPKTTATHLGQRLTLNSATYCLNGYIRKFGTPGTKYILIEEDPIEEDTSFEQQMNPPEDAEEPKNFKED